MRWRNRICETSIGLTVPSRTSGIVARDWRRSRMVVITIVVIITPIVAIIVDLVGVLPFLGDRPADVGFVSRI